MGFTLDKPNAFFESFERKGGANLKTTHYCPGCGHGIVHKLLAEAIDELAIQDRTILITSIGCSVFMYYYFDTSAVACAHGRAPAAGTAVSRGIPDSITVSYQGDGDLSAIGTSHIIHAANRGENMIVLFINNNNYGMTGGQLAPTTLLGQITSTSPYGRSALNEGYPIRMSEIIAGLEAPVLVARTSVSSPIHIRETKRLIQRGLQAQIDKKGFSFIEILSMCPTNWHMTPVDSAKWIEEDVVKTFPLKIFKDEIDQRPTQQRPRSNPSFSEIVRTLGIKDPQYFEDKSFPYSGKELKIKIAGFGGQGILSLGLVLANLGIRKGLEATWLPSYGPEMRGGVANCSVVLSENKIASPVVEKPDILIAMNKPSLFRFAAQVPENGIILYNSSMSDELPEGIRAKCYAVKATDLAIQAGNIKAANTVCLAAVSKVAGLFTEENLHNYIREQFKKNTLVEQNNKAIDFGWQNTVSL